MAVKTVNVTAAVSGTFHDGKNMIVLAEGKKATVSEASLPFLRKRELIDERKTATANVPAQSDDQFVVPDGYTVTEKGGGWYEITGPEGFEAVKAQGTADVAAKLAEIADAGDETPPA